MDNHNSHNDDTLWAKWLAGTLSEEEKAQLNPDDIRKMERIREVADQLQPGQWDEDTSWESLQNQIHRSEPFVTAEHKAGNNFLLKWSIGIAASVLIAVGLWFYITSPNPQERIAQVGEHKRVYLPDSSIVLLNADSRITYYPGNWDQERTLELTGEAYFEVRKGNTFTVATDHADVTVIGTSFNINTRSRQNITYCYTGKVKVVNKSIGLEQILTPGKGIIVKNFEWKEVEAEKSTEGPGWINGKFSFQSTEFVEVVEELKRQFGKQIVFSVEPQTLGTYTGFFFNDDLEDALKMVCEPMEGITYEIKDDGSVYIINEKESMNE